MREWHFYWLHPRATRDFSTLSRNWARDRPGKKWAKRPFQKMCRLVLGSTQSSVQGPSVTLCSWQVWNRRRVSFPGLRAELFPRRARNRFLKFIESLTYIHEYGKRQSSALRSFLSRAPCLVFARYTEQKSKESISRHVLREKKDPSEK